jgi:hypothetical protein
VQVVTGVVGREHPVRIGGVANDRVEVDHRVEGAAGSNPGVDGLPGLLLLRRIAGAALERGECPAEDT